MVTKNTFSSTNAKCQWANEIICYQRWYENNKNSYIQSYFGRGSGGCTDLSCSKLTSRICLLEYMIFLSFFFISA